MKGVSYGVMAIDGHATPEGTQRYRRRLPTLDPAHFLALQGLTAASLGLGTYLGDPNEAEERSHNILIFIMMHHTSMGMECIGRAIIPCARRLGWLLACGMLLAGCAGTRPMMIVAVPIVDVRTAPHTEATAGVHDDLQETQALYGEYVRVVNTEDGWARIESVEQPEFTHQQKWQGYPGWVPQQALVPWQQVWQPRIVVTRKWARPWLDIYQTAPASVELPMGAQLQAIDMAEVLWRIELVDGSTAYLPREAARSLEELRQLPEAQKRRLILAAAEQFIGDPYLWGGRSPHAPQRSAAATGVDCSGLVNLAFRAAGISIPRDAHEQSLRAAPVKALQPGDLLFLSERGNPKRIVHVMLYAGDGEVLEAPGTGAHVRRLAIVQRLGQSLDGVPPGSVVDGQTVTYGTYFK
jgi:cell wall-associated NlpC family hydrolase